MGKFIAGYCCGVATVFLFGAYLVAQEEAENEKQREENKKRAKENKA